MSGISQTNSNLSNSRRQSYTLCKGVLSCAVVVQAVLVALAVREIISRLV